MKQTVNFSSFRDAFFRCNRGEQFTYEALELIFDYIEEYECSTGDEVELDPVGICCEWAESTPEELCSQYPIFEVDVNDPPNDSSATELILEWLNDETQVAGVTDSGSIVYVQF